MKKLPSQNNAWTQKNNGNFDGDIYSSFNLDLQENMGRLRLGKRLVINTASTDITMFCPVAFKIHNSNIYSLGGSTSGNGTAYKIASTELSATSFSVDNSSNAPADIDSRYSDMTSGSNGNLYATSGTYLYEATAGVWSATTRSFNATTFSHMLASFGGRLYVTDSGSVIRSCDISTGSMGTLSAATPATAYTLYFGNIPENNFTFIRAATTTLWAGAINTTGGKGYMYTWDGVASTITTPYRLESSGPVACVIKDDVPWIVDTLGNLLTWNGGTFVKVASFYRKNNKQLYHANSTVNNRFIHPNGMTIVNGNIRILVNNLNEDNGGTIEDSIQSGVWEYTKENGLYHVGSVGLSKVGDTITDYGQIRVSQVGAISDISSPKLSPTATQNGMFLVGCAFFTDATTVKHAIFYDDTYDTLQKSGYFITTIQDADDGTAYHLPAVKNSWNTIYTLYRKLLSATDKIDVKCRTTEVAPIEATITWTSTTTFTTTTNISAYWTSGTGGEVEVIQGIGSGQCSHITSYTLNAGTYTVTVDGVHIGATGTSKARFQNWRRLSTITSQLDTEDESGPDDISNWIQIKIWCVFTGKDEIERLFIINSNYQPAN